MVTKDLPDPNASTLVPLGSKQAPCLPQALERVDVVLKAHREIPAQHGVRIEIADDDEIVGLFGLVEEGTRIVVEILGSPPA